MKLARIFLCAFSLLLFGNTSVFAQDWEFGVMVGGSNYHGDLAYNIVPKETHLSGGVHMRYNINPYWSYRPSIIYAKISGDDANFAEYRTRNLNFQSEIWEVTNLMEMNFVPFGSRVLNEDFSSYVTAGLTVFRHNPKAEYQGNLYALRKLGTEGQTGKEQYGLLQLAIPFGGGFKYNVTKNFVVGWEVLWRKTFTDYLDDVSTVYPDMDDLRASRGDLAANLSDRSWETDGAGSQLSIQGDERGDPELKDFYFITGITLTYRLTPIHCWPKYKRQIRFK